MDVVFSDHARKQLTERKIAETEVLQAIKQPHKVIRQDARRYLAIRISRKNTRQHLLIVVYDNKDSVKEVVTAFITSKIEKYL